MTPIVARNGAVLTVYDHGGMGKKKFARKVNRPLTMKGIRNAMGRR